jgi:pimeloyl-ACP methyl ester carboxylesterase
MGLHTEVRGTGPTLLLIPGGNGDAGFYAPLTKALADTFTVIAYDRRGFSRSRFGGDIDDDRRLATDGDDARRLIEQMSEPPAFVFGSSSGAIVALDLLIRYPDHVRTLVAHEPPIVTLLPDGDWYLELFDEVYHTYRRRGTGPAIRKFAAVAGVGPPRMGEKEFWRMLKLMPRIRRNMKFWLEHELRQYPRYRPDIHALQTVSSQLVLAGGQDSREFFPYRCNTMLADLLGTRVIDMAGGHAGYRTHTTEFAQHLMRILHDAARGYVR